MFLLYIIYQKKSPSFTVHNPGFYPFFLCPFSRNPSSCCVHFIGYILDGIFVFSFYFSPSIRFGSTTFTAFFDVSSPVIAQWRSEQEGTEETYDGIVGTSIARLTHRYDDFPRYEVSTLLERERSIQEISGQIQDYALPFFARFSNLPKLLDDVEQEGFFPHRKGFDVPKRNREFIECFREYLQKQ